MNNNLQSNLKFDKIVIDTKNKMYEVLADSGLPVTVQAMITKEVYSTIKNIENATLEEIYKERGEENGKQFIQPIRNDNKSEQEN